MTKEVTKTNPNTIQDFLSGSGEKVFKKRLTEILPSYLTADRMVGYALKEFRRNPKLAKCTTASFLGGIMKCAELGLAPSNTLGHVHLIPYEDRKNNRTECQFMLGYQGMLVLAYRIETVAKINARIVYENDHFEYEFGSHEFLKHIPALSNRGAMTHAYADVTSTNGAYKFEVLTCEDVNAIMASSKTSKYGPWQTHYEEMAKKSAIRRLFKTLPVGDQVRDAVASDERVINDGETIDAEGFNFVEEDVSTSDTAAELLEGK